MLWIQSMHSGSPSNINNHRNARWFSDLMKFTAVNECLSYQPSNILFQRKINWINSKTTEWEIYTNIVLLNINDENMSLTKHNIKHVRERQDKQFTKYAKTVTLQVRDIVYLKIHTWKSLEAKWLPIHRIIKFHVDPGRARALSPES